MVTSGTPEKDTRTQTVLRAEDPRSPATISDVARLAGVSKTTVSHVLSGRRPVSDATRAKVNRVIEELGFQQNFFATGLTGRRTQTIALVVQDLTNPFYPALARGLQQTMAEHGHVVLLADVGAGVPPVGAFLSEAVQRRVDGVVVAAIDISDEQIEPLRAAGIGVVTVGDPRRRTTTDVISSDDERIAADAVAYLHDQGHRRLGIVSGPPHTAPGAPRLAGYRNALRAHGLRPLKAAETTGDWTRESGAKAMTALMDLERRPTAVFCANDLMAIGALDAARVLGLAVPGDVAVVGVDDIDAASLVSPALTTIRVPAQDIGRVAGEQLMTRIGTPTGPARRVLVQHSLVVRESA
ncbi:LacI family DNA-binding transcriptional regulator [Streptomyces tagetis]|uniref:LacI family DNA-binding transcriptional regulator n=1 Tax=Streptomyces tagetis TaxID=2820809 RepID=A0A941AY96_9ACTN|nr:LacI family DNA-binding transcriptional regulator [Streptomyces sp. RG38]MBQ0827169.1 LacI family DNA-binding transcriptional regulator [Streptomyces sp. RG38]